MAQVESYVRGSRGSWSCPPSANDKPRQCAGTVPYPGFEKPVSVKITLVGDAAAAIVITTTVIGNVAETWVAALRESYGAPASEDVPGTHRRWRWARGRQTVVVTERVNEEQRIETSVALWDAELGGTVPSAAPPSNRSVY